MQPLADRVAATEASGIRKVFDLAASLKNPVNLSIGQPDFDVPQALRACAIEAINNRKNAYTQTQGGPELRAALKAGPLQGYEDSQILVTSAVSGGLLLAYMALLNPGDEVLVPDPYFVMYKQVANMINAKPVMIDTYPDFRLRPEAVEKAITPRTRALILGTPSNPTGVICQRSELEALAVIAKKHDIIIIADEIYESYCYDGPFARMRDVCPSHTLTLGGFSKSHAMTGWRIGWAAGPAPLVQAMTKFQQFSFVCAPAPFQVAAAAAVTHDMSAEIDLYRKKRDMIYDGLVAAGFEVAKPSGAFYIFPKAPWGTGTEFVEECIRNNLLIIPGGCFSEQDTNFRIAYAATEQTIEAGLTIMRNVKEKGK